MSRMLVKSKKGPLYIVKSKKSIVLEECSCVKCRLGWNWLRLARNAVRCSRVVFLGSPLG